jgi:cytochrome oxidase Cu insertion factor (SCO1/SenC/PrrC family)
MEPSSSLRLRTLLARACLAVALAGGTAFAAPGVAPGASLGALPQSWRDDGGQPFSLAALGGRPVVVTMAYANCHRFCPMTMDRLRKLQATLDAEHRQADFVIVGLDPDDDDPATWHHYRRSHHLERGNWHFLSGAHDDVAAVAERLGFEFSKMDEHVMHDTHVLLFDTHGVLAGELPSDATGWPAVK